MPTAPYRRCTTPGCPEMGMTDKHRGRCRQCQTRADAQYDYGPDWPRLRMAYLVAHPACALCGVLAQQVDHHPRGYRQLVDARVKDPHAWRHLRSLCIPCHASATWRHQPPSWALR